MILCWQVDDDDEDLEEEGEGYEDEDSAWNSWMQVETWR